MCSKIDPGLKGLFAGFISVIIILGVTLYV